MTLKERRVNRLVFHKEKAGKAQAMTVKSAATISKILPGKMDMTPVEAGKAVEKIQTEKDLVVVVEASEAKSKCSGSREALVETGKEINKNQPERSVGALVEAVVETAKEVEAVVETAKEAVAVDRNRTGISARFQKFLDEVEWVDEDFESGCGEDQVDEEDRKHAAELEEHLERMWVDCLKILHRHGVEFADPSDPHCLVAC